METWRNGVLMLVCAALLAGCGREDTAPVPAAGEWVDLHAPAQVVEWALPTLRPSIHQHSLALTHDGRLLLSWLNSQRGRRHILQFSTYEPASQRWRGRVQSGQGRLACAVSRCWKGLSS